MKQRVVIIGHGYTSRLGIARALGREGYEVYLLVITRFAHGGKLNTSMPIDGYSKFVDRVLFCPSDEGSLIHLLLSECADSKQKVVIIPDSDFSSAVVDQNSDLLNQYFVFPNIDHKQGSIVAWMDKIRQKELAESISINVAKGWKVDVIDGHIDLPDDIQYPCFPKPRATLVGGKNGLRRCDNESDLKDVLTFISKRNPNISILVEEFKEIDYEHALLGISDGSNVNIPGIITTTSLASGGHYGVAKCGVISPITGFEDIVDEFKSFVLKTGFVGIFDIDFFQSRGKYYFCEMNFRYGGSGYAYTKMGTNLPHQLVRVLLGEELPNDLPNILRAEAFVNERMCRADWCEGYISTLSFLRLIHRDCIKFIDDEEDPMPQVVFLRGLWNVRSNFKRIVKRFSRWFRLVPRS